MTSGVKFQIDKATTSSNEYFFVFYKILDLVQVYQNFTYSHL